MKTVSGWNGVDVASTTSKDTGEIDFLSIGLDIDTRNAVEFIKDFQRMAGIWQGYDFATRFKDLVDFMDKYNQDQKLDAQLRLTNPAVAEAYEHYQTMLALAKEHKNG